MGKKPKVRQKVTPKKRPKTGGVEPEAVADRLVAWRVGQMDLQGRWGWTKLVTDDLAQLHAQLVEFEAETFSALKLNRRAKRIPVDQLCRDAQQRLLDIKRDDVDDLWELRIPTTDKWRAWGVVDGSIFYLLWWDPDHTVCTRVKKGTARARG